MSPEKVNDFSDSMGSVDEMRMGSQASNPMSNSNSNSDYKTQSGEDDIQLWQAQIQSFNEYKETHKDKEKEDIINFNDELDVKDESESEDSDKE